MIAYKLFKKRKNGTLGPLFINVKQIIPLNKWLKAKCYPTKGYTVRPGWHTTNSPKANHLSLKNRVWAKVEIEDFYEFKRPEKQGGIWYIAKKIKVLKELYNV